MNGHARTAATDPAGVPPACRPAWQELLRLAADDPAAALLHPPCALAPFVHWTALDDEQAVARVELGGFVHDVTVSIDPGGAVRAVTFVRWGDADGRPARERRGRSSGRSSTRCNRSTPSCRGRRRCAEQPRRACHVHDGPRYVRVLVVVQTTEDQGVAA